MMTCEMKNIIKGLADIVFPPGCIFCGAFMDEHTNRSFCPHCFSQIHFVQSPQCTCCGVPFPDRDGEDHLCGECIMSEQFFSVARSLGKYNRVLLEAIHLFKYQGKVTLGKALGRLMTEHEYRNVTIRDYSIIIPVPLHKQRLKERGFNQSLILARELSTYFSIPLDFSLLKRTVHRKPQTMLKKKERLANVKGAFEVKSAANIKGKKILLVDDVYTTGSTVKECSRMLLRHEAAEVAVLTLARVG
jgi:ComF family protein